jgi:hypothetical protein
VIRCSRAREKIGRMDPTAHTDLAAAIEQLDPAHRTVLLRMLELMEKLGEMDRMLLKAVEGLDKLNDLDRSIQQLVARRLDMIEAELFPNVADLHSRKVPS